MVSFLSVLYTPDHVLVSIETVFFHAAKIKRKNNSIELSEKKF